MSLNRIRLVILAAQGAPGLEAIPFFIFDKVQSSMGKVAQKQIDAGCAF
jgi:hypothetical protein